MLREHANALRRSAMLGDAALVALSFVLAYHVAGRFSDLFPLREYLWIVPLFALTWIASLYYFGIYDSFRTKRIASLAASVVKAGSVGFLCFGALFFTIKAIYISRTLTAAAFVVATAALVCEKVGLLLSFHHSRRRGYNSRHVLLVGTSRHLEPFIRLLEEHAEWGLRIIGIINLDKDSGDGASRYPRLAGLLDLPEFLHTTVVDEVILSVPKAWFAETEDIVRLCEIEGVKVNLALNTFKLQHARVRQTDLDGYPLLCFESAPEAAWELQVKRCIDVAVSAAAMALLAPVFLAIAAAIKLSSPGPVFFRQRRCGLNGRIFTLYKFRTMQVNAEAMQERLRARNQMKGPVFKIANDPRVTRFGRWLRTYSLDELPQLWNVLRGDMSLVGPRPPLPSEVRRYQNWQRRRLRMRPGLTCLWQVNGRNRISDFNDWARLDLQYMDNWSLKLDCKILLKTVPAVVQGTGAH